MTRANLTTTDGFNPVYLDDPYYNTWGTSFLGGAGVEISLTDFLQARVECRFEDVIQLPTAGLSIRF